MKKLILSLLYVVSTASFQLPSILGPFHQPFSKNLNILSNITVDLQEVQLRKRDGNCPINYNSCSTLAAEYGGACCVSGSHCTTDRAHQIACCTIGAQCTGILDRPTLTTTNFALSSPAMTKTTSNIPNICPTVISSVVNNIYYPFPYSPTTFCNKAQCLDALGICHRNYEECTAEIQGTNYGVTILVPAGGVTVAPTAQSLGISSATKICSSLSSQACYGIKSSDCDQFGGVFATPTASNSVTKPTMDFLAIAGMTLILAWKITSHVF